LKLNIDHSKLEDGIKTLSDQILADARRQAAEISEQAQKQGQARANRAQRDANEEAERVLQGARHRGDRERRQTMAAAELDAKQALLAQKEELIAKAFSGATDELARISNVELLSALVGEAVTVLGGGDLVVQVNARDQSIATQPLLDELASRLADTLDTNVRLRLAEAPAPILGGCRLTSSDGRVAFDNSYETRLERVRDALRVEVYNILAGSGSGSES
jgi:V/A-type H+-transporting ATPase subunit E